LDCAFIISTPSKNDQTLEFIKNGHPLSAVYKRCDMFSFPRTAEVRHISRQIILNVSVRFYLELTGYRLAIHALYRVTNILCRGKLCSRCRNELSHFFLMPTKISSSGRRRRRNGSKEMMENNKKYQMASLCFLHKNPQLIGDLFRPIKSFNNWIEEGLSLKTALLWPMFS
jgi:hypothetical protein